MSCGAVYLVDEPGAFTHAAAVRAMAVHTSHALRSRGLVRLVAFDGYLYALDSTAFSLRDLAASLRSFRKAVDDMDELPAEPREQHSTPYLARGRALTRRASTTSRGWSARRARSALPARHSYYQGSF